MDDFLEDCLRSSFEMAYDKYEIIMSVSDESDLAVKVALKMIAEYPLVDAKLEIGNTIVGANPKINNLYRSYHKAKYDIIWMYDSNTMLNPNSLQTCVEELTKPHVGLVHHLPRGMKSFSFGALLESIYMGTSHARMYLSLNYFVQLAQSIGFTASCVTGKSMMFRRSTLQKVGGIEKFGNFLAEDNTIGAKISGLGLKHSLCFDFASQLLGKATVSDYVQRRIRWARLRFFIAPIVAVVEPLTECLYSGLFTCWAVTSVFPSISAVYFFLTHSLVWFSFDWILYMLITSGDKVSGQQPKISFKSFLVIWAFRELIFALIFLKGLAGNTVEWRGRKYELKYGGSLVADKQSCKRDDNRRGTKRQFFMNLLMGWISLYFGFPNDFLGFDENSMNYCSLIDHKIDCK